VSWFSRSSATVTEAHNALAEGAKLLDVRTSAEWKEGRAVGAVHTPPQKLERFLPKLNGAPVYVICRSGNRSKATVAQLRRAGIDAMNVRGGMISWQRHGLPTAEGGTR